MTATFHENPAGVHYVLHDEDGPLGQTLARLANRIVGTAQQYANVDTGTMRSRIEFTIERDDDGLVAVIAARTEYAYYVHEGTIYMEGNPFLRDAAAVEIERGVG